MQINIKDRQHRLLSPINILGALLKFSCLLLLLTLSACNSGNSQSGSPSGSLQMDTVATVPVLANKATTTVIYIHNTSNLVIDNISYSVANNIAKSASNGFSLNQKSCTSIAAHGACALEFTTPELSAKDGNVQGSALIRANFMQDGKASYSQQLINYTLLPVQSGLNISSDIRLKANQYGTVYVYAESGNYDLQTIDNNNPQIRETTRSSQTLTSPQVVAVELSAGAINQTQNVRLNLNYKNQTTKNITNSQFSINATPTTNGAILTSGQLPILNTTQSTSGQMLIYNSGNQSTTLGAISGTNSINIVNAGSNRCISNSTNLAAGGSCIVYFTVPQAGNSGTISITYGASQLIQTVTWYNSINEALLQMVASPSTVSFNQGSNSESVTITAVNIGGYELSGMSIPPATNPDGGSATATTSTALSCKDSNNNSTGANLPVGGSCSYKVILTDSVAEANKNLLLKIGGNYITSSGGATYQRSTAISYTSTTIVAPTVTILTTPNPVGSVMMSNAFKFTATISGTGSSTVTAVLANPAFGIITSSPGTCSLSTAGITSCSFTVLTTWDSNLANNFSSATQVNITASGGANLIGNPISYVLTTSPAYLPQTGQTPESPISTSSLSGADGATYSGIAWAYNGNSALTPATRFQAVDGGCAIKDSLTGLVWLKDPSIIAASNWNDGLNTISTGTWCSKTAGSWRMPNLNELLSIINYSSSSSATWLETQGFTNLLTNKSYWTSSTFANLNTNAWYVSIVSGITNANQKDSGSNFLWPVYTDSGSGYLAEPLQTGQTQTLPIAAPAGSDGALQEGIAWPSTRFVADATGNCLTDNLTGLTWVGDLTTVNDGNPFDTWNGGLTSAANGNWCGYTDWRMPNIVELRSLINFAYANPALWLMYGSGSVGSPNCDGACFSGIDPDGSYAYMTSSTFAGDTANLWYVYFSDGTIDHTPKNDPVTQWLALWPVRGGYVEKPLPLVIFLSSTTRNANLGGVIGADQACQADPKNSGAIAGTYKALIVTNNSADYVRRACTNANCSDPSENINWVLKPNTTYYKEDMVTPLFTTNSAGIYNYNLGNMPNSLTTNTNDRSLTGLNADWTSASNNCSNWTVSVGSTSTRGGPGRKDNTFIYVSNSGSCNTASYLMCVKQ